MILDPCVQLLKVAPELRVCIQHNSCPAVLFFSGPLGGKFPPLSFE